MPYRYEYVEPEVLIEVEHVTVYFTYKNDEEESPFSYWYSAETDAHGDQTDFDVRDLPNYQGGKGDSREYHAEIIKEALCNGDLNDYLIKIKVDPIDVEAMKAKTSKGENEC